MGDFETIGGNMGLLQLVLYQGTEIREQVQQGAMDRRETFRGAIEAWCGNYAEPIEAWPHVHQGKIARGNYAAKFFFVQANMLTLGRATLLDTY